MYVCMHACIYTYICIYTYVYIYIYIYMYMYMYTYVCIRMYTLNIHVYVRQISLVTSPLLTLLGSSFPGNPL